MHATKSAMSIPLGCAAVVAMTGSSASAAVGVVGVLTGVRTIRSKSPDRAIRERVFDAVRTAAPSGDPDIDRVARDRLRVAENGLVADRLSSGDVGKDLPQPPVAAPRG